MDAQLTLTEIRTQARTLLPGARIRQHLYWRYSLIWVNAGRSAPCGPA
jgi:hypothetical protein